jgi:hypothetical protein
VAAIRAAIARLEAQLNHPNADRDAIQQSIAHERKRLALYGVTEGHTSATMDKISHGVKSWNKTDRNVEQLITQGHTIKFHPDKIEIFKGGELVYSKDGNFSNVSNGLVVRAKNLVSNLIYKSKQGVAEGESNAMANTAKRLSNKDDGKVAKLRAAGDKRREEELKGRNIAKKNEAMLPKSAFAGSDKNKLGPAAHAKGKQKGPVKKGQFVGGMEEEKKKGADGKACWKGYRYAGTKNGKDKCVPVSEDVENIMSALIESILRK